MKSKACSTVSGLSSSRTTSLVFDSANLPCRAVLKNAECVQRMILCSFQLLSPQRTVQSASDSSPKALEVVHCQRRAECYARSRTRWNPWPWWREARNWPQQRNEASDEEEK